MKITPQVKRLFFISVLALLVLIFLYYSLMNSGMDDDFYNQSLSGIPYYKGQEIVQNTMQEDGNCNTSGILSYVIADCKKTPKEMAEHFIKHTDEKRWNVKAIPSDDSGVAKLEYDAKDEQVISTTQVIFMENNGDLMIILSSFYEMM